MNNLWERFENIVSKDEVETAKSAFSPIEEGNYKAILESIEPAESQTGLPMLKGKFRIVANNRVLFYNQMLQNLNYPNMTATNIAEAITFIGGLLDQEVEFEGLGALANLVGTIPIGGEHTINVTYGKKDFDKKYPKLKVVTEPVAFDSYGIPADEDQVF